MVPHESPKTSTKGSAIKAEILLPFLFTMSQRVSDTFLFYQLVASTAQNNYQHEGDYVLLQGIYKHTRYLYRKGMLAWISD